MSAMITYIEENLRILKMGTTKLFFYFPVLWQIVYEWITKKNICGKWSIRLPPNKNDKSKMTCPILLREMAETRPSHGNFSNFHLSILPTHHLAYKEFYKLNYPFVCFPWLHISLCECEEIVLAMIDYMTDSIHNGKFYHLVAMSEGHNNRRILHSPLDILLFN